MHLTQNERERTREGSRIFTDVNAAKLGDTIQMKLVQVFTFIILKIDLTKVKLNPVNKYENLRQQIGVDINTVLSGPRIGQWIGGRVKKKIIYLFFRVSDPPKAKRYILRSLRNYNILTNAKIRIKGKKLNGIIIHLFSLKVYHETVDYKRKHQTDYVRLQLLGGRVDQRIS